MQLEQQVTSLELSKKLKELGVKQESLWVWWYTEAMSTDTKYFPEVDWEKRENTLKLFEPYMKDSGRYTSAYTVAELGNVLEYAFKNLKGTAITDPQGIMITDPRGRFKRLWQKVTGFEDEANNRAKLIIYLRENNLLETDTSNNV